MSKTRAYSIMLALFLMNLFCLFEWAVAEKGQRSWQQFAIAEDTELVQLGELLKHNQDAMDQCFQRPINTR